MYVTHLIKFLHLDRKRPSIYSYTCPCISIYMSSSTHKYNNTFEQTNMWGIKTSIYDRQFNALRSAQQKYARRCNYEKMTQVSLEMAASGYGRAAYEYMATILVEDKFPHGANLLWNHMNVLSRWKKLSSDSQQQEIAQMCYNITHTKSDRHPAYLARLALKLVDKPDESATKETQFASKVESIILRMPKKNELPTPEDVSHDAGMKKLHRLLFERLPTSRTNSVLFDYFKKNWTKQAKSTSRLYIYNLVGRIFHKYMDQMKPFPTVPTPDLKKVDLDDYVYDKHTVEGKKRKRGIKHFLDEGAKVENPSDGILARGGIKRKAEKVYLQSEKDNGTRNANSRFERKRLRATFNELTRLNGGRVVSSVQCQKPCGSKPKTMYVTVEHFGINGLTTYFVKGPYKDSSSIEFQNDLDARKSEYGLMEMGVEIHQQENLYYLVCLKKEGFENMSSTKFYNDTILWNLVKVLIFRAAFNVSDTNMRNVMVNHTTNEVLSVDEMTPNRMAPRGQRLVDYLFNKPPKKMFCDQVMGIIRKKSEDFVNEVKKYGELTKHLLM